MSDTPATLEELILRVAASINVRALYPPQHPRVVQAVERALETLGALVRQRRQEAVTFLLVEDDLVVDERPLRKASIYQQHFIAALRRLGIEALTLARGLTAPEYQAFIAAVAAAMVPESTAHVAVGRVTVAVADGAAGGAGKGPVAGGAEPVEPHQIDTAREAFVRFRRDPRGALKEVDALVWGLMESLARSTRAILPVAPLREHDEYTFVHSVHVSLLTLAQARSLGLQGPMLHSVGVSALLHDIGKLKVPIEVLNKPGQLDSAEWEAMKSHAELGAAHLAGIGTVPPLAMVVAYEHHLRYDGRPNYPLLGTPRRPTLASQMTALSDTYDAICTLRPYQQALSREAALRIVADRAGTFLDPVLVGHFHRVLGAEPPSGMAEGPGLR